MWSALFGGLFVLLLSGVWVGVALGITAIVIMHFFGAGISVLRGAAWDALNLYSLCALPGFIFMGQVILASGLGRLIYESVLPLMARFPGKLLLSNVLICAMFAAVLGSSAANAAVVGSIAIPELRKRKYNDRMVLGTLCVSGTLALMIPPSNAFILYGVMADTSIAALFAAGTIPGIIMALGFMTYIVIKGKLTPSIAPAEEKYLPFKATLLSLLKIWPLLVLMVACVGTVYLGWTTPVEGAGVGAFASIIVGRIFGKLGWRQIQTALVKTVDTSSMIFLLVLGAMLLSVAISSVGLPRAVVQAIGQLPLSATQIVLLLFLMYLVMGCFIDGISMLVITLPFVMPIISVLKVDPIWFGVQVTLLVEVGQVTPPVGLVLYVVKGIAGANTSLSDIAIGSLPFLAIDIGVLGLLFAFPELTSFLPGLFGLL